MGAATPVITGCGTGQALRKLFNRHLLIYLWSAYGVQGALLITNVLLDTEVIEATFLPSPAEWEVEAEEATRKNDNPPKIGALDFGLANETWGLPRRAWKTQDLRPKILEMKGWGMEHQLGNLGESLEKRHEEVLIDPVGGALSHNVGGLHGWKCLGH